MFSLETSIRNLFCFFNRTFQNGCFWSPYRNSIIKVVFNWWQVLFVCLCSDIKRGFHESLVPHFSPNLFLRWKYNKLSSRNNLLFFSRITSQSFRLILLQIINYSLCYRLILSYSVLDHKIYILLNHLCFTPFTFNLRMVKG